MTNLAMALVKEPRIAAKIPRVVAMAAEFKRQMSEWNIRCDPEAAALVFASGIPVEVTTWEMGRIAKFGQDHVARLRTASTPLALLLSRTVDRWCELHRDTPALYDPFAVSTIVKPGLAEWRRGRVEVELRGEQTWGYTVLHEDGAGPHHVTWATDRDRALDFWLQRVLATGAAAAR
jgi:purine nucleosidase